MRNDIFILLGASKHHMHWECRQIESKTILVVSVLFLMMALQTFEEAGEDELSGLGFTKGL